MEKKKICMLGLGYIGLPTAAMFATHGHQIIGVDINASVVDALNEGQIVIKEPYLDIMVQAAVRSGNLKACTIPEEADVFIIAVPTPITKDKKADMSYVISAAESIVPYLKPGNVVILESTSPIGTISKIIVPIISKCGLKIGEEIFVAHSPERVLPGRILIELVENNRIVGGINSKSSEIVKELYETFVKGDIYLTDAKTAEMCKLMENTYRDVNIALANELAIICEKANVNPWEVISLCNKHPRVNLHQPGPGVGGHCIAVDPWFIVEKYPEESKIISTSRNINAGMPAYVLTKIEKVLKDIEGKKKVTILGITYKPDVDDIRESPIIELIELIKLKSQYDVKIVDPYVKNSRYTTEDIVNASNGSDLILLGVNHKEFAAVDYKNVGKVMRNKNIIDTRNFIDRDKVEKLGFNYYLL